MSTVKYLLNDALAECDPDTDALLVSEGLWADVSGGSPAQTNPGAVPPPPPVVTLVSQNDSGADISWTASSDANAEYAVTQLRFASGLNPILVTRTPHTSARVDLGPGIWELQVTAYSDKYPGGHSEPSKPLKVTIVEPVAADEPDVPVEDVTVVADPPSPKRSTKKTQGA